MTTALICASSHSRKRRDMLAKCGHVGRIVVQSNDAVVGALSRGFTMKRMNEIHSKQVRRRSDRSIDIEFYRRHAATLRGELIAEV